MPFLRRSKHSRASSDRAGPAAVFSVAGHMLHAGMDRAMVLDRLGPPSKSTTVEDILARYDSVAVLGKLPRGQEYWLYEGFPTAGQETRVVISGGVLAKVSVHTAPTTGG